MFYAPWCGHCKNMKPDFSKLAKFMNENNKPVKIAKVDATVHGEIATKFNVQGYPTLFYFQNGEPKNYEGERTFEAM